MLGPHYGLCMCLAVASLLVPNSLVGTCKYSDSDKESHSGKNTLIWYWSHFGSNLILHHASVYVQCVWKIDANGAKITSFISYFKQGFSVLWIEVLVEPRALEKVLNSNTFQNIQTSTLSGFILVQTTSLSLVTMKWERSSPGRLVPMFWGYR